MNDELNREIADALSDTLSTELESTLGTAIPGILAQVPRKFNIDQVKADSGNIGDLDVDKIILGNANIDSIVLSDTNASLNGAQAFLQNVRSVLELRISVDWGIDLGWFGSWDGTINLGSLNFGFNLGNVEVPSLSDIDMHIPSINIPNASLSLQPVNNLDLGGAQLRKLQVDNTDAPSGGFTLSGMGVGSVAINDVSIPRTSTEKVTVEEFSPTQNITLPGASVSNLQVPAAQIDNISAGGFDLSAIASRRCLGADIGILALHVCVQPVIHMDIGSMLIQDAELSARVRKLDINEISIPVTLKGIQMRKLNLNSVKINKISL